MSSIARWEAAAIMLAAIIFGAMAYPALRYARRDTRDSWRQTELARYKIEIEQYNNKHKAYPLQFQAGAHKFVVVTKDAKGATGWYLQAQLENPKPEGNFFDAEAGRNYDYRIANRDGKTYYEICGGDYECK